MKTRFFFRTRSLFILAVLCLCAATSIAQQQEIVSTVHQQHGNMTTSLGRDFWFAIPQNYEAQSGKFFNLYIASERDAVVHVQIPGIAEKVLSVSAGQVLTLTSPDDIPLSSEIRSSNKVEQKAIHVWSDDADLSVYLLSRNPATTDGMYVIPTIGWGKEYVVAAYASLFEGLNPVGSTKGLYSTINRWSYPTTIVGGELCRTFHFDNFADTIYITNIKLEGDESFAIKAPFALPMALVNKAPLDVEVCYTPDDPSDLKVDGKLIVEYDLVSPKQTQHLSVAITLSSMPNPTFLDYPSEFIVLSHLDNTTVTIVPSCDIREDQDYGKVIHPKGESFTVVLNEGECIQYQAAFATNSKDYDVTGTSVTADHGIGVIGASACTNIPGDFPYCDHILEMVPPIRTLSNTYITAPFANRVGGDTYLVIATQDGQVVKRNGNTYHTFAKANEPFFTATVSDHSEWTSDAPFLLAQYINSTTWEDDQGHNNQGVGDPGMVVINPVEQFRSTVVFQTPTITYLEDSNGTKAQHNFTNYVNLILPVSEESVTTFDGTPIASLANMTKSAIGTTGWEAVRIKFDPGTGEGAHVVNCQSGAGVGVYLYGYGPYDSYCWAGNLGVVNPMDSDIAPPHPDFDVTGITAKVSFSEVLALDSKISDMVVDSLINMKVSKDKAFRPGEAVANSYYQLTVVDAGKPAYALVSTYDMAGNRTQVESNYTGSASGVGEWFTSDLERGSGEYTTLSKKITSGEMLSMLPVTPNPASLSKNSTVSFYYGLGSSSTVDLAIYDILGNTVATVVHSTTQSAGIYKVSFNPGSDITPGTYLYRLSGAGKVITGKLVIER